MPAAAPSVRVDYERPWLYPKQSSAFFCEDRISCVEASTKAGKTVAGIAWLLEQAMGGQPRHRYWWVAPVYGQAEIAFRRTIEALQDLPRGLFGINRSDLVISLAGAGTLDFRSGEKPDNLYGEDVYAAVVDEASRLKEASWHALRSTLTATEGPVRMIGNVRGRQNWFWRLARRAENGEPGMHYERITWKDAVEAGILNESEIDAARRDLPPSVFRELYECEPSDDAGNPFGYDAIASCLIPDLSPAESVVWGWDLAKSEDWTVGIGLDAEGRVCRFHRWQKPWQVTEPEILAHTAGVPALVDSTGVGDPIVERLQSQARNFQGFKFSSSSKQQLMEGLTGSIHRCEVRFPDGILRRELDSFQYEYTRTGVRYSAPDGMHDDCVIALALADRHLKAVGHHSFDVGGLGF